VAAIFFLRKDFDGLVIKKQYQWNNRSFPRMMMSAVIEAGSGELLA